MVKAIWNNRIIAETHHPVKFEGHNYFPLDSVHTEYLKKSEHKSTHPIVGEAHYFDIDVEGKVIKDAAWMYPHPTVELAMLRNHVAFSTGVQIQ